MTSTDDQPSRTRKTPLKTRHLAFVALAVLALVWGYNWVVMKVGIRYAEPFTFAALRAVLSAVFLFPLVAVLRKPLRMPAPRYTVILGILQTTGFVGLIIWALEQGSAGRTSVLAYTMPFWVLLMAWPILGEKIRGLQWPAVGLALLGLILILSPWHMTGSLASSLMAIAAGFCWGLSAVVVKMMQRHHPFDLLSFTAWQMLIGAIPLAVIAVLTIETPPVWSGSFIAALAFNVLPANALAWFLWLYALRSLPAGIAGIGSLAIPVVGVLAAWIQLGERPHPIEAVGMILIIAALGVLTLRGVLGARRAARGS